jgi:TolB protein
MKDTLMKECTVRQTGRSAARSRFGFVLTGLVVFSVGSLLAERERVLKQINVPHDYYYREMYLPQATTGPSGAAWSPDGTEIVFSQHGYLWRHRVGTHAAEQLTTGPGYDYQPDWSPDGRFIVFAAYENDRINLRLLDLSAKTNAPLLSDGNVHLEPRWSPDGRRLAFVSTAFAGRWHVFVADFDKGALANLARITEDHDSGLPRYYYSRFDHYLSPTWSPDGRALIVVSNRDRVWGTGGFWRVEARAGTPMTLLHDEETTWKARPDWARDGRVVYSSYHGRQWNQLWLMTKNGGEVVPLTFGDFDATSPRWSPSGQRIAYVSNEDGNTSLWLLDVPGGRREPVQVTDYRHRVPVGRVDISITDEQGHPTSARVSVTDANGRGHAPDSAWWHADDGFDRKARSFEYTYFHVGGVTSLTVPTGAYQLEIIRGLQYAPAKMSIDVGSGSNPVTVKLARIADLDAKGWRSGDLHVHMNYGGNYRNDPKHLAFQAEAEDLNLIEALVVNKEQRVPDIASFSTAPAPVSNDRRLIVYGQEFHTSFWGHMAILGLQDHFLLPGFAGYANTAYASLFPHNAAIEDLAHEQKALTAYVHAFETVPDPVDRSQALSSEFPADVALGKVDYLEVVGFADHRATAAVWYRLLNCGFRIPAGAGTDAMANYASLRGPVGMNRVFARTAGANTHEAWLSAIKSGRTFATNGPLLQFTLDGHEIGDEIALAAGSHQLTAHIELNSVVPVDHLEIVRNGEVIEAFPLDGDRTSASLDRRLSVDGSGWYTVRAWNDHATHPVLDIYPFATTSPIYVTVGKAPVRSRSDAAYFIAWMDRLEQDARAHMDWNTPAERDTVLASIGEARRVFQQRMDEGGR